MVMRIPPPRSLDGEILPAIPADKSDYELALHMAGANVHAHRQFGSYQGDWWALVTVKGKTGWITDSYGSCSGCDAFEAEFGWSDDEREDYAARLANFGRRYLDDILTQEQAEAKASENGDWDIEADEMAAWIRKEGRALAPPVPAQTDGDA
jgi:hypothetical protein